MAHTLAGLYAHNYWSPLLHHLFFYLMIYWIFNYSFLATINFERPTHQGIFIIALDHLASSINQLLSYCHSVDRYISGCGYVDVQECVYKNIMWCTIHRKYTNFFRQVLWFTFTTTVSFQLLWYRICKLVLSTMHLTTDLLHTQWFAWLIKAIYEITISCLNGKRYIRGKFASVLPILSLN